MFNYNATSSWWRCKNRPTHSRNLFCSLAGVGSIRAMLPLLVIQNPSSLISKNNRSFKPQSSEISPLQAISVLPSCEKCTAFNAPYPVTLIFVPTVTACSFARNSFPRLLNSIATGGVQTSERPTCSTYIASVLLLKVPECAREFPNRGS
jgi:hypothetical protein